ncbi:MAG: hypothetical protein RL222_356 [Bacteroidota bacterium]|jgi:flavin reductase (DIM6/NTAB) family NADH-FMN oxidoreductase RutF
MTSFTPSELDNRGLYGFFTSAVIPRPIAFVSTIDLQGNVNLAPFSYFNMVSTRPPLMLFAPVRLSREGRQKDTYENVKAVPECVIHICNFAVVEQMNATSEAFPPEVDEMQATGLTPVPSDLVRPPRVQECPVAFECRVTQVIELGESGGAGSLVLCEILKIHADENILDEQGRVQPEKLDAVARLGGNQYLRITKDAIFELPRPL